MAPSRPRRAEAAAPRRHLHAALGGALLCSACLAPVDLALPSPEGARSLAVLEDLDGAAPRGWLLVATDDGWVGPDDRPPRLGISEAAPITLLAYEHDPEALQLALGRIEFVPDDAPGRRLPSPQVSFRGTSDDGHMRWTSGATLSAERHASLRVAPLDVAACWEAGGCPSAQPAGVCRLPCPAAPAPAPPASPDLSPPPGWVPLIADGPVLGPDGRAAHAPPAPERLECDLGMMRRPDEAACRAIAPCPAPGAWPTDVPPGAVFVRAGGGPGDGSPEAPFERLATALGSAPAGTPVVFEGAFELAPLLEEHGRALTDRPLVGVCPERSSLHAAEELEVRAGPLDLSQARLHLERNLRLTARGVTHRLHRVEVWPSGVSAEHGDLEISDSSLRTPDEVGVVGGYDAGLFVSGCYFFGRYGIHMYRDAAVRLRDSILESNGGAGGHGISASSCREVDLERFLIRGYDGSGVTASETPRVRLVDGSILDLGQRGLIQKRCNGVNVNCLPPDPAGFALTATITRVHIRTVHTALEFQAGRLALEDVVVDGRTTGIEVLAEPRYRTELWARRVVILGGEQQAIRLAGQPGATRRADIEDLLVRRGENLRGVARAMLQATFFDTHVSRAYLQGQLGHGVEIGCAGGTLSDVFVEDVSGDGVRLLSGAATTVTRLRVRGAGQSALRTYPNDPSALLGADSCATLGAPDNPRMTIRDVQLEGGPRSARGLTVCAGGRADVTRARITGFEAAVYLQEDLLELSASTLLDNELAVSAPPALDLARSLMGVSLSGNRRAVETRADAGRCP